jgi:hypothetical protein
VGGAAPVIHPLLILPQPNDKFTVLCENHELSAVLENDATLSVALKQRTNFERGGYKLFFRGVQIYDPTRPLYEYLAVKL